jgi:hypothetical protein
MPCSPRDPEADVSDAIRGLEKRGGHKGIVLLAKVEIGLHHA